MNAYNPLSSPAAKSKQPTKATKTSIKANRELRIVLVSSRSRETVTEYRRKQFARLKAAKDPKAIKNLLQLLATPVKSPRILSKAECKQQIRERYAAGETLEELGRLSPFSINAFTRLFLNQALGMSSCAILHRLLEEEASICTANRRMT
jgi:hypothetical protein